MSLLSRIFVALCLLACPVLAEDVGVKVGETIPNMLVTENQDGQMTSFDKLTGEKGAILLFTRSVDWCPYCQKQFKQWNENAEAFTSKGYNIIGITHEPPATIAKFHQANHISYPILSDKGASIVKAFGILNTEFAPDHRFYGVPYPTVYVTNNVGRITHRYAEDGFKARPDIGEVKRDLFGK